MKLKGVFYTVVSACLFGVTPLIAKKILQMGMEAEVMVFYRNLLSIPILLCILWMNRIPLALPEKSGKSFMQLGIFGISITTLFLYSSYRFIPIGTATTLHFLYPLVVAIIAWLWYHERISKGKWMVLAASMVGVLCFLYGESGENMIGIGLAVASAVSYGYYIVRFEKTSLKQENTYLVSFWFSIVVSGFMLTLQLIQGKWMPLPSLSALPWLAALALGTSVLAVAFLQLGIRYLGSVVASILCLFEPIASLLVGITVLQERIRLPQVIGCIVILISVLCLIYLDYKKERKQV